MGYLTFEARAAVDSEDIVEPTYDVLGRCWVEPAVLAVEVKCFETVAWVMMTSEQQSRQKPKPNVNTRCHAMTGVASPQRTKRKKRKKKRRGYFQQHTSSCMCLRATGDPATRITQATHAAAATDDLPRC